MPRKYYYLSCWLLLSMHLAGLIGLQLPQSHRLFIALTPFNLLVTGVLVFLFHQDYNRSFIFFGIVAFLTGYLVEVAGVHTGYIFGRYTYGPVLGYALWEVPLLIGLNWLVLVYCTGIIGAKWEAPAWQRATLAASLMVLLDVFIEPVATQYKFWSWHNDKIPLQNYAGWFLTSWLLLFLFYRLPFQKDNKIAPLVYIAQVLFFAGTLLSRALIGLF